MTFICCGCPHRSLTRTKTNDFPHSTDISVRRDTFTTCAQDLHKNAFNLLQRGRLLPRPFRALLLISDIMWKSIRWIAHQMFRPVDSKTSYGEAEDAIRFLEQSRHLLSFCFAKEKMQTTSEKSKKKIKIIRPHNAIL